MNAERVAELRELCEKATVGHWNVSGQSSYIYGEFAIGYKIAQLSLSTGGCVHNPNAENDAAFIAAARTALPGLLDEVERLRKIAIEMLDAAYNNLSCEYYEEVKRKLYDDQR